jgi:hypothetical protein
MDTGRFEMGNNYCPKCGGMVHDSAHVCLTRWSEENAVKLRALFLQGPRDWPEDATHENGDYCGICRQCGEPFSGHKRRMICKPCANTPTGGPQDA